MEGLELSLLELQNKRRVAPLSIILGVVFLFFCGVLIFVFIAAKRANPVMLDPQGRPVNSSTRPANSDQHR